ncbi:nuclear transport factor 2 family protein [bacterium]|nr:MAG: nuclear transport factor 2 family protein [bacterium]
MRLPTSLGLLLILTTASFAQGTKAEIEACEAAYRKTMLKEDIRWFESNLAPGYTELDQGRTFKRDRALKLLRDSFATSRYRSYISTPIIFEAKGKTAQSTTTTTFVVEDTRPRDRRMKPTEVKAQIRKTWTQANGRWQLSRLEVVKLIGIRELKS